MVHYYKIKFRHLVNSNYGRTFYRPNSYWLRSSWTSRSIRVVQLSSWITCCVLFCVNKKRFSLSSIETESLNNIITNFFTDTPHINCRRSTVSTRTWRGSPSAQSLLCNLFTSTRFFKDPGTITSIKILLSLFTSDYRSKKTRKYLINRAMFHQFPNITPVHILGNVFVINII